MKILRSVSWLLILSLFSILNSLGLSLRAASVGSSDIEDPALKPVNSFRKVSTSPWAVDTFGATGVGLFRDIQVPVHRILEVRADGRKIGAENQPHLGLIFAGKIAPVFGTKEFKLKPLSLSLMRMSTLLSNADTFGSSYSRVELLSQGELIVPLGRPSLALEMGAGYRRSEFTNGSTGHYVSFIPLQFGGGFNFSRWSLKGYGSISLQGQVGYTEGFLWGGSPLKGATTEYTGLGGSSEFRMTPAASLVLGIDQEMVRIKIPDVNAYEAFGLKVFDPRTTRDYNMVTSSLTLGIRKLF